MRVDRLGFFQFEMWRNFRLKALTRLKANDALYGITVLEQDQGRDTLDIEHLWHRWVGIDIHLTDTQFAFVLLADLIHDGRNHLTRTAPFCPEVNQDWC